MTRHEVSDADLCDYVIMILARKTGKTRGYWRRAGFGIVITSETDGSCNWTLRLGDAADAFTGLEATISAIQHEFPYAVET